MKPIAIDCGSRCRSCDGFGIMTLYTGPAHPGLLAPCIECSPRANLNDLLAKKAEAVSAHHKAEELRLIDQHNERMRQL